MFFNQKLKRHLTVSGKLLIAVFSSTESIQIKKVIPQQSNTDQQPNCTVSFFGACLKGKYMGKMQVTAYQLTELLSHSHKIKPARDQKVPLLDFPRSIWKRFVQLQDFQQEFSDTETIMHSVLNATKFSDMVHKHRKWHLYIDCSDLELTQFYCDRINLVMEFSNHLPRHTQMTTNTWCSINV